MLKIIRLHFCLLILICFTTSQSIAITGEEISAKVSEWLVEKGVNGTPVFSKNISFKDCENEIEIKKLFQNYKTIKVNCLDKDGFALFMRVQFLKKAEAKKKIRSNKVSKILSEKSELKTKNKNFKVVKLKRSLEKNDVIKLNDLETLSIDKKYKISFFSDKKELIGRKLKKNLKMGQILHPRHLFERFDVNYRDYVSIVSTIGNASVTVSGEAQDSGNLGDLIKVKNLKSGKIVKGYIKKDKIIKVFR